MKKILVFAFALTMFLAPPAVIFADDGGELAPTGDTPVIGETGTIIVADDGGELAPPNPTGPIV